MLAQYDVRSARPENLCHVSFDKRVVWLLCGAGKAARPPG
jgi:hypothetical protein